MAPQVAAPSSSARFKQLLQELQEEHESSLSALQTQILKERASESTSASEKPAIGVDLDDAHLDELLEDLEEQHLDETPPVSARQDDISVLPGAVNGVDKGPRNAGQMEEDGSRQSPTTMVKMPAKAFAGGSEYPEGWVMRIMVVGARNLPLEPGEFEAEAHPYCVVETVPDPNFAGKPGGFVRAFATKPKRATANPMWHHEDAFIDLEEGWMFKFTVRNKETEQIMGEAILPCDRYYKDGFKGVLPLMAKDSGENKKAAKAGQAKLSIKVTAPPQTLLASSAPLFDVKESWQHFTKGIPLDIQNHHKEDGGGDAEKKKARAFGSVAIISPVDVMKFISETPYSARKQTKWEKIRAFRGPRTLVFSPNFFPRVMWDLVGLILIVYDMIVIPMQAFNAPPSDFSIGMDYVTLVFWTFDLAQSWFLAYTDEHGELERRQCKIAKHYIKTWFSIDALVVVPDWFLTLSGGAGGAFVGLGRLLRGFRAVRVLRLLRLLKLKRIINLAYDRIESEHILLLVNMVKQLLVLATINHLVACVWYYIGNATRDAGQDNWIDDQNLFDSDLAYKYFTSHHWSLTQFTPASIPISATNLTERIFSVVVLFFAMVCFSTLVGSITAAINGIRTLYTDETKQFWLLRRFFRQKKISFDLSQRIQRFLEHRCQSQHKVVQPKSINILAMLSENLQHELENEVNAPCLLGHPFFIYLKGHLNHVLDRLCHLALKQLSFAPGDTVFTVGDKANWMAFVRSGELDYSLNSDGANFPPTPVVFEDWVAEPALWSINWWHRGEMTSKEPTMLVAMDPAIFIDIMRAHPRQWIFAKAYAETYIAFLNQTREEDLTDVILARSMFENKVEYCSHLVEEEAAELRQ